MINPKDDFNFSGIIALSNCSGSIVTVVKNPSMTAHGYTSGHCLGMGSARVGAYHMPAPGETLTNITVNRRVWLLDSSGDRKASLSKKLIYGTMTNTDMGLYELNLTYAEIKIDMALTFMIAESGPDVGDPINIVSGYWRRDILALSTSK